MAAGWFVDGAYLYKVWQSLGNGVNIDFLKLRSMLEKAYNDVIDEAYYFNADPEPPTAQRNAFHNALAYPPPTGPGLRVKLYWVGKKKLAVAGAPVLDPRTGQQLELIQQKGVDVGLAFHLTRSFSKRGWKQLFLAAGDGDFSEVVQYLVETENVNLVLVGTVDTMSEELRPYARAIFDIRANAAAISR